MTIVAWSGDLDRVWPQLILATTGAAYGMTTTVFFTFWGLFTLKRPEVKITGSDWKTKGLGAMNRQGLTTGLDERGQSLVDATYDGLGYTQPTRGSWYR